MIIPKKITILLPFFLDGGVERAMINLSREMIIRNIEVDFVFIKNKLGPLSSEIPDGCKIFEFNKKGPLSSILQFIKYLRKERPSLIISNLTPANILAVMGGRLSFIKLKIFVGIQIAVKTNISTSLLKSKLRPFIYKLFFRLSDYIIAVSGGIKKDLLSFGIKESKIKVIYNPVYSIDTIKKGDELITHSWFKDKNIPVILAVGRLHKQKDFPLLIKSFSEVLKKKNARLVILGEGEERKNLELLINQLNLKNHIDLIGFVKNPYSYMKNASLFVLSSAWEGFGNVVAEAMSFGLPIVSTDCPWGPSEILENGKYGILVPVGDYKTMSEAIIKLLNDKSYYQLNIDGSKRFRSDFILDQYLNLLN